MFELLTRLERWEQLFVERRPLATYVFMALCLVMFAGQMAWDARLGGIDLGDPGSLSEVPGRLARLIAMGANAPALVVEGEYFRLATANFLHANWWHLAVNLFGLSILGPLVERIWGTYRYVAVFLLSSLTGAAASTWLTNPRVSVGVSTALLGLIAAYFWIWWRGRSSLPPRFSVPADRWVSLVVINGVLWWFIPAIDHWGHIGGAAGGLAFAIFVHPPSWSALGRPEAPVRFDRPPSSITKALAMVLSVVFVAAALHAALTAAGRPVSDGLVPVALAEGYRSPVAANQMAWVIVTAPDSDSILLEAARSAAKRAVDGFDSPEGRSAALDTLATAHYRLGDFDAAIEASWASVQLLPRPDTQSQLLRFLHARSQRNPTPYQTDGAEASKVLLSLDDGQLHLTTKGIATPIAVIATWNRDGQLEGGIFLRYPADGVESFAWSLEQPDLEALRHPNTELRVAFVASDRVKRENAPPALQLVTMAPEIRSLP